MRYCGITVRDRTQLRFGFHFIVGFILGFCHFRTNCRVVHQFYVAIHIKAVSQIKSTAEGVTTVVSKASQALTVYNAVATYIYHQF